ncbi:DUF368 domain-containing protein [Ohtaekwangia sp.]|uniref:DUF368 domain-containing protein n=1 Tax=Ohtaekwangia sp. TaxID=2066019 RepID=UPI002FDDC2EF
MKKALDYILLYVKGLSMGAVDVIPGISGGTVAFVTGIHQELIYSIRAIDREAFSLLVKFRFAEFWQKINGNFLLTVFAGIFTSIFLLAPSMAYLLRYYSIPLWSLLFGLILIAAPLALRKITRWTAGTVLAFLAGIVIMYTLTRLNALQLPAALWMIFVAGVLCSCGMLLPGVSGAFLLVFINRYQAVINAVSKFNGIVLITFLMGGVIGLLGFSRVFSWVLNNYRNTAVAFMAGFMLGSLNKVWPWRQVQQYVTNGSGEQVPVAEKSVLPWDYVTLTGKDPHVFQAILMMALGVFIVVLTERITARLKTNI